MSDNNGRIERWANMYPYDDGTEWIGATLHNTEASAASNAKHDCVRRIHLVELRDGEEIIPTAELTALRNARSTYESAAAMDAKTISGLRAEIETLKSNTQGILDCSLAPWSVVDEARRERDEAIARNERSREKFLAIDKELDHWRARALAAESKIDDAGAKFERWTAAKLLAQAYCGNCADNGDYEDEIENATSVAALLRSHYFPAEEA